jgi:hypothetical protein
VMNNTKKSSTSWLAGFVMPVLTAASLAFAGFAHAQDVQQGADVDPPSRAARISEVTGQVWLYSADAGDWVAADLNRPLTTGDRLATDPGARAELQLGSTTMRLDSSTELEVVQLDDEHFSLELHDGSVIAQVRDPASANQFEMNTEEGRFVSERPGSFRFDRFVVGNGGGGNVTRSDATVYSGQVRYEGNNSALPVQAGQRAEFWIDASGVAQYTLLAPANDAFTAWSNSRDRQPVVGQTQRYVSPEMTGSSELDQYGRWDQDPDYGAVWVPTAVAADWAPYSHGHWTWVRPWGWTWVDDAPWGFAPFHYGRWVYARNNWCWTPGTRVARPVYAPALVAWVGGGGGSVSVNIGGGPAVGWFPLAPREVYVPSYRTSPRYIRNVNITNVRNVTVINNVIANPRGPREFENRRSPRAITVVPEGVMRDRRPVAPAAAQYRQTPWVRDLANQPSARVAVSVAAPIARPAMPVRGADQREVRPPPGMPVRPIESRPGFGQPRGQEPGRVAGRPQQQQQVQPQPQVQPGVPNGPGQQRPQIQPPATQQPQQRPEQPQGQQPPQRPQPTQPQVQPQPQPQVQQPQGQQPQDPQRPNMRPLPIRPEERRNDDRRIEDRRQEFQQRQPNRPEANNPQEGRPQQPQQFQPPQGRIERPMVAPAPRPVEAPPQPRAPEVQRVAPVQPAARQDAPRQEAPQRREEPRAEPKRIDVLPQPNTQH